MMGMLIGNMMNIVLDPVMILGFGWDVAGAAIATVLGNIFAAGFYIWHLLSKNAMLSIHPKYYQAGKGIAIGVFAIGVPASRRMKRHPGLPKTHVPADWRRSSR